MTTSEELLWAAADALDFDANVGFTETELLEKIKQLKALAELGQRLRPRITSVADEDVEAAGVTWAHVNRWLAAHGWGEPTRDEYGWLLATSPRGAKVDLCPMDSRVPSLSCAVNYIAQEYVDRCALDILDEIAAVRVEQ